MTEEKSLGSLDDRFDFVMEKIRHAGKIMSCRSNLIAKYLEEGYTDCLENYRDELREASLNADDYLSELCSLPGGQWSCTMDRTKVEIMIQRIWATDRCIIDGQRKMIDEKNHLTLNWIVENVKKARYTLRKAMEDLRSYLFQLPF